MTHTSPLLSIIVPCYNVANFVSESLASILSTLSPANYAQVELILINDGATDSTPTLLEQFIHDTLMPLNLNYQYINQANAGLSQARNNGLAVAKGEYVYFFDSDDLLLNNAVDKMLAALQTHRPDMLEFDAQTFITRTDLTHPKDDSLYRAYFLIRENASDDTKLLATFEQFGWYVWARCYKKSLFATHQFEAGRYFEDMMLVPYLYLEYTNVVHIPDVLIGYRQNPNSITTNVSLKHLDDIFFALTKALNYQKSPDLTTNQHKALTILVAKIWRTMIMIALKQRIYKKDPTLLKQMWVYKKRLKNDYGLTLPWYIPYFSGKIGLAVYRKILRKIGLMPPATPIS